MAVRRESEFRRADRGTKLTSRENAQLAAENIGKELRPIRASCSSADQRARRYDGAGGFDGTERIPERKTDSLQYGVAKQPGGSIVAQVEEGTPGQRVVVRRTLSG